MIRSLTRQDRGIFLTLLDEFYHSPGVLHPIPAEHYERAFEAAVSGNPYLEVFMIEQDKQVIGYGQVSLTWSTEAGGLTAMLEELYIRPEFQGQGIGCAYFAFINQRYAGKVSRFRLEVEPDNAGAQRLYTRQGYQELPYLQMRREFGMVD